MTKWTTAGVSILLLLWNSRAALAQVPEVTPNGIVSAASWSSPVAAGQLIALFGKNFAGTAQSAPTPLPMTLGGVSVTINGRPAPIAFVSPTQINAQVPASLKPVARDVVTARVVVSSPAGSSAPAEVALSNDSPGFFTADGSGCGPAAALTVTPFGSAVNSAGNSAAPGDYMALFGTGFGIASAQPADGNSPVGSAPFTKLPWLVVDGNPAAVSYAGLAPLLVGVDQLNFQVPASTRNGCAVPVFASQTFASPRVSISVQRGRGQCVDPPIRSGGQISFNKGVFSGPPNSSGSTSEGISALFPSGPDVVAPAQETPVFAPNWARSTSFSTARLISTDGAKLNFRNCAVPGYSNLSAGNLTIKSSGGVVSVPASPLAGDGVSYSLLLPAGFVAPGAVSISGSEGGDFQLQTSMTIGAPIQLQSTFPAGTVISSSHPLTIKWTGGDPGSLVKLSLYSGEGESAGVDVSYADAAAGTLTMAPVCGGVESTSCSFGLPLSSNAQLTVQVQPAPNGVTTVRVLGLTDPVRLSWQYSHTFTGLTLGL